MNARIASPLGKVPDMASALSALEVSFEDSGLDRQLMELVRQRASQLNGCVFCLHQHVLTARVFGELDLRLHMLAGWRESSLYTSRERAALGWTEALTHVAVTRAPDEDYAALEAAFNPTEQVQLTLLIGAINTWNRLQIGFRIPHPTDHRPEIDD